MLLAGGQGSRLYALTNNIAKPAVPFGAKYRIIDFPLSNCINSGIDTVGVLTQYQPLVLNEYIGNGQPWDLDRNFGGVHVLSPYQKKAKSAWYEGTANAIYQNLNFIKMYKFSDLINYEVYENGQSKVKGRAGSALIGGAFFGLTGLIVGSSMSRKVEDKCNQLKLIIRLNDLNCPQIVITYVDNVAWDKAGFTYRTMKENLQLVCSALEYIMNAKTLEQSAVEKTEPQTTKEEKPLKEQMLELKEMLDSGLITQEEYELKKKRLLNL